MCQSTFQASNLPTKNAQINARNTNSVYAVPVMPALTNAANTFTTLTLAAYTLFVCASAVSDTTQKQDNFSTSTNSWRGVTVYPTTVTEWDDGNLVRLSPNDASEASQYIRRLFLPFTLRRSNLTAGCPVRPFFIGLNPHVREIFHDPVLFYHF